MAQNPVERKWPRRLLHVPSMESLQRSQEGYYGTVCNPSFNAVSYTWGRFAVDKGSALNVSGISWQIPCIDPKHFAVTGLQGVLNRIAGPNGLVWIDIACIDQEDRYVKMDEIGNQGDIFRLAHQVYIWLTTLGDEFSGDLIHSLDSFTDHLEHMELAENSNEYKALDFVKQIQGETATLRHNLEIFFKDPWFSSLWTLQEACLCEQAILLIASGHTIPLSYGPPRRSKSSASLELLNTNCQTIKINLLPYAEHDKDIKDLLAAIDRSGLSFINPGLNTGSGSLLLYSAARYRSTLEPLDRIYGIMQAFGLRLGSSREPEKYFTLPELED